MPLKMFKKMFQRNSLFHTTAATVAAALIIFQFILIAATAYFIVLPMTQRSTDDLAALLVLSAKTWVELPPETRKDFEFELAQNHQLVLFEASAPLPSKAGPFPYLSLLEESLAQQTGLDINIKVTKVDTTWYWVEIPSADHLIRIGFPKGRLNVSPPMILLLTALTTIVLTGVTAFVLARRISKPLIYFSLAAKRIGEGNIPEILPETNIIELSGLASSFNLMALQVRELLARRTIMLAGVSHDLRTPLARMRLAIEMLPESTDPNLIKRLQNDIEEMNQLIGEFHVLSRDLQKEAALPTDVTQLLRELTESAGDFGKKIELNTTTPIVVPIGPLALRRILTNLLSNAVRYGAGKPVEIFHELSPGKLLIRILDQGAGIPPGELENVFRPFYRLESSRSIATGGSGLGLAIARQLADANGWNIALQPRPEGGTEARIEIPLSI